MACAWTAEALGRGAADSTRGCATLVEPHAWRAGRELARSGFASPTTSSVGRLFDTIAALCGIRATVSYEGQAAFELQAACDEHERGTYPLPAIDASEEPAAALGEAVRGSGGSAAGGQVLDARATVAAALSDLNAGVAVPKSPPASTMASPRRPQKRASIRRSGTTWSWSCSPAGSSRTDCCWSEPPRL